ncbi:MAG: GAF domain-containing sensor histidine kinase [Chloroflexi bacterium]|nr:GAF domain-containing sensor histidine kinase [Chloroflexota bacterium]
MGVNSLVPLAASLVYIVLLVVIVLNHRWQEQHKLFALYLVAAALWSFSTFLLRSDFLIEHKLFLFRILILASVWWIVQLYYFVKAFLNLPGGRWIWVGYASLATSALLAALGYWPVRLTFAKGVVTPYWGWYGFLYVATIVAFTVLAFYSLVRRFVTVVEPEMRNRITYLLFAIGLLAVFGFSGITPLADKFPLGHLGGLLAAFIFTYAILKHELVNINAVLRRSLGWASLFVLGGGTYILFFYLLHLLFDFELELITLVIATLVAAAVAIFIYRLRPVFLEMIEQLFYRGTYSYRQALLGFSSKMGNIINLDQLADEMLPTIVEALRTSQANLLFEDNRSGDFTTQFAYPQVNGRLRDELTFNLDNPIVTRLEREASPLDLRQIDIIPQFKGLWQTEKRKLADSGLDLLCPIKSRGKLIGILALGRKRSGTIYTQEDRGLLMSLASQAGIIMENARMFDSLKRQQHQVEQLLTRAVVAQEEERERISADLHDSVAQWLIAASYRVQTCSQLLTTGGNAVALDELTDMENTLTKSVRELRRVVIGLRPPALDELGLSHALRQSLDDLKTGGLICKFREVGMPLRLSSSVEIAAYRIVQEGLNNIHKHANATRVNLRLQFQEDKVVITIRDNGDGFDLSQTLDRAISGGHVGLLGMKQRAEILGGDLKIKTSEGAGTNITLSIPIPSPLEEK